MAGENGLLTGALTAAGAYFGGPLGAVGGGLLGQQLGLSGEQAKLDKATIQYNREQAKLAAADKALQNARGFRKAIANQMALANFRGGPGSSIASQFGVESMSSFLEDQQAIQRGMQGIDTAASLKLADTRLGKRARDYKLLGSYGSNVLGGLNLSGSEDKK